MADFDFTSLDPSDGLEVIREEGIGDVSLRFAVRSGGERREFSEGHDSIELTSWRDPTVRGLGECERLHIVLDAVARYLTTGGDWIELKSAVVQMGGMLPKALEARGWHYHSGEAVYDDELDRVVWQHIFVSDTDQGEDTRAILWVEGSFIEEKTLGQLLRERRDHEEGIPCGEDLDVPLDPGNQLEERPL